MAAVCDSFFADSPDARSITPCERLSLDSFLTRIRSPAGWFLKYPPETFAALVAPSRLQTDNEECMRNNLAGDMVVDRRWKHSEYVEENLACREPKF
jgi:hypothetical protein